MRPAAKGRSIAIAIAGVIVAIAIGLLTRQAPVLPVVLTVLLLLPGPYRLRPRLEGPAFLGSHAATAAAGVLSALVIAWVWGSLSPAALVHDEAAYLLQARVFAAGHWVAPSRPLPEFFEQMHVFVTPILASKYPPGHSLLMVPGIWLGLPALVPILLAGGAGALLFAHARRIAGGAVALVSWLLWMSAPGTFAYRASYLSENTTMVLWLLALWALVRWLESERPHWLVLLAACLGWGAITRPMTMFALAVPIGIVVLRRVLLRRLWAQMALGAAVGVACLAVLPIWNARTLGDWRSSPYREYSRVYFPYEWTGFGVRPDSPVRALPRGTEPFDAQVRAIHAGHTVRALPETLLHRFGAIAGDQWGGARGILGAFAVMGAWTVSAPGAFAAVSAAALVGGYLFFAHSADWNPYYLEAHAVLSFLTALGLCGVVASILARLPREVARAAATRRLAFQALVLALCASLALTASSARGIRNESAAGMESFRARVAALPAARTIVFVRYGPASDVHRRLVVNEPDLDVAGSWVVHDLGERNGRLLALAPDRRPFLYDEARESFAAWEPQPAP